jgi:hypothetical protein
MSHFDLKVRCAAMGLNVRSVKLRCRQYQMDPHAFLNMLERQAGRCAICERADRRLFIDHDHATGAVRELLCSPCNNRVGAIENPLFDKTAAYVRKHSPS